MMYGDPRSRRRAEVNRPSVQGDWRVLTPQALITPATMPPFVLHNKHRHHATRHMSQRGWTVISPLIGPTPGDTLLLFSRNDCVQHCGSAYTPGSPCSLLLLLPHTLLTSAFTMDVPEPDQSPFTAVTAHTSKLTRVSSGLSLEGGGGDCDQRKRNALPPHFLFAGIRLSQKTKTLC